MDDKRGMTDYSDVIEYEKSRESERHHRGKSSEDLLDKGRILDVLPIRPGQVILDAGCGNGYMSREFARLVGDQGKVYALDPDSTAIEALRADMDASNVVAVVGDVTTRTDLPSSTFDLVYLSTVFHCFSAEQIGGFAEEVRRLLAPDGRLAIVEMVKRVTPFGPPINMRFSADELKDVLALSPLETIEVGDYFYMQVFGNWLTG